MTSPHPLQSARIPSCAVRAFLLLWPCFAAAAPAPGPTPATGPSPTTGPSPAAEQAARRALDRHHAELGRVDRLAIVDFDLPYDATRLWVVDAATGTVLAATAVTHARRSGGKMATRFSNVSGSLLSSRGAFRTDVEAYVGDFGRSLRIDGLERGVNHRARPRDIVIHPAGNLTHSSGCFMLPDADSDRIIDLVVGGTLWYAHVGARPRLHGRPRPPTLHTPSRGSHVRPLDPPPPPGPPPALVRDPAGRGRL